ncbi:hypothetical protein BS50DRAFT_592728 [Corynespora cassiicola Philippines]|uniref:WD40 repeat-like protein n=1 Tax=Corynespora cassiicola Philippines TaxID=1448308 RepID=A0A2T2N8K3_CORCC|nr:hypothetical protein BS50DRAFT_592728 [Corynespora cassiicola Philippines]
MYLEPLKDCLQQFQVFTISPDGSSLIKKSRMLDLPYVVDVRTGNKTIIMVENEKGLKDIVNLHGSPSFSLCSKNMAVGGLGCVSLIDMEKMEQKYNKGRQISDILRRVFGNRLRGTPSYKCRNIPLKMLPDILEFSPNGQRLAATVGRHVVKIWDVNRSPVLDRDLQPRDRLFEDIYFSKDGEIVVVTEGKILEVFRVTDGRSIYVTYLDPFSGYSCLTFIKDCKMLALTCSFMEKVGPLLVDVTTGRTTEVSEEDIELIHLSRHLEFGKPRGECSKATIDVEFPLRKYFGHSSQPRPSNKAKEITMELDTGKFCLRSAESPGNLLYAATFLDPGYSGIWIYHLLSKKVLGTIRVDKCVYALSFIDDTTFYTNLGIFRIDFSGNNLASQASITKIVEITDRWITLRDEKALQIPAEYRRRVMASRSPVSKDIVAISKPYGGLMFIEFDFSKLPK